MIRTKTLGSTVPDTKILVVDTQEDARYRTRVKDNNTKRQKIQDTHQKITIK